MSHPFFSPNVEDAALQECWRSCAELSQPQIAPNWFGFREMTDLVQPNCRNERSGSLHAGVMGGTSAR